MNQSPKRTWLEICVAVLVAFVVLVLSFVCLISFLRMGQPQVIQLNSNMKRLGYVMTEVNIDAAKTGNTNFDWTCTNGAPMTLKQWKDSLVDKYLTEEEFDNLMGMWVNGRYTVMVDVYAVTSRDPDDTLLFSSKNWRGIKEAKLSGNLFGQDEFVCVRKNGFSSILFELVATNAGIIGAGGKYNYLPLK